MGKIEELYNKLLLDLDKDPEIKIRLLKRLERLCQEAAGMQLQDKDLLKANYLSIMREFDEFLDTKGFSSFKSNERLTKAINFFEKCSQEDFEKHLANYQQIRQELWKSI